MFTLSAEPLIPHFRVLGFVSEFHPQFQLLAKAEPEEQ